jgi:hypothetical protein
MRPSLVMNTKCLLVMLSHCICIWVMYMLHTVLVGHVHVMSCYVATLHVLVGHTVTLQAGHTCSSPTAEHIYAWWFCNELSHGYSHMSKAKGTRKPQFSNSSLAGFTTTRLCCREASE